MGDIGKGNQATSYPTSLDTDTSLANCAGNPCVGGDSMVAGHINNPAGAIVAIETALGITPQGTAASVAARLSILLANDGGLPRGTSFPVSPVNVPQLFYRTDQNLVYFYNTSTGTWVQLLTASALSSYVPIASPVSITAQHTFAPGVVQAPFILGANAQGQRVIGLAADSIFDGVAVRSASPNDAGSTVPVTDASGTLRAFDIKAVATQTASVTLAAADMNKLQILNSAGAITITLPAATIGTYWVIFKNIGAGAATISGLGIGLNTADIVHAISDGTTWRIVNFSPNGIVGTAGVSAAPLAYGIPLEDGAGTLNAWATVTPGASKIPLSGADTTLPAGWAGLLGKKYLISGASYTPTTGTHQVFAEAIGGGGGGGGVGATAASQAAAAAGGGNAGYAAKRYTGIGAGPYLILVAGGGVGGAAGNNAGGNGGETVFMGPSAGQTCTITIASPAVVSATAHGLLVGQGIIFTTTGALPTGLVANTIYFVSNQGFTANSFEVAATPYGTPINTSGSQSGVHTVFGGLTAGYGGGGNGDLSQATPAMDYGGFLGVQSSGGDINLTGAQGGILGAVGIKLGITSSGVKGGDGLPMLGNGGTGAQGTGGGSPSATYGSGGGGAGATASQAAQAGGAGGQGIIIIWEFS